MYHLLILSLASQVVPAGELSTNERLANALIESFPASFETERQGAMQLFFLGDPFESFVISVSPPSPFWPGQPNVMVLSTDDFDRRKARLPVDAGVLADDGSLILAQPRRQLRSGERVRYSAFLGNDVVQLLEKVWDAALIRAHTHYRAAQPILAFDGFVICIRDDIPGHSDVVACVSSPLNGTTGATFYPLGQLLFRYAEAPTNQHAKLKDEIRRMAQKMLIVFAETPAKPPSAQP